MPYPTRTSSAHMPRTMARSDEEGEMAGSCLLGVFIVFIGEVSELCLLIRQEIRRCCRVLIDKVELNIMRLSRHSET
jgi:hypothetical protein